MINVTMDSVCIVFTLLILLFLRFSPDRRERLNRLFAITCLLNIGMLLGDLPNWLCEGNAQWWFPSALWLGCLVQYLSGILIVWIYTRYLCVYLSARGEIQRWVMPVADLLCAVDVLLILLSQFNGIYYLIDSSNIYRRAELYWLSQLFPLLILIIDIAVITHNRSIIRFNEGIAFTCYLTLPIIAIVVQLQMYGIAITYLASSVALFILFLCIQSQQRLVAVQNKRELDRARIMVAISQIQPHFLYNSLQGIKHLCDVDSVRASTALEHFSYYLRNNLDALSETHAIPFSKEIDHVEDYLSLEKMRFGDRLRINMELDCKDFLLPPLAVQAIAENAVRHGIAKKKGGGTLTIRSEQAGDSVVITIADDGVGFDPSAVPNDERSHVGIANVGSLLQIQCGGKLELTSQKGVGTTVKLTLPLPENR